VARTDKSSDKTAKTDVSVDADIEQDAALQDPTALSEPEPDTDTPEDGDQDTIEVDLPDENAAAKGRNSSGFVALLLGGIAAAVIGFAFARVIAPDGWPIDAQTAEITELRSILDAQAAAQEQALRDQVQLTMRLSGAEGELATLRGALPKLGGEFAALNDTMTQIEARLAELESRPVVETTPDVGGQIATALDGYRAEVEALKQDVADQAARAEALSDEMASLTGEMGDRMSGAEALAEEAKRVERAVLAQGALAALGRAVHSGAPYEQELAALSDTAGIDAPAALGAQAKTGIPTLSALQDGFAPAARAALSASLRVDADAGLMDRLGTFLKAQTGARSLTPREGDDPDAVLSRAEAALRDGRVDETLALIATLPAEGQAAMMDWGETAGMHAKVIAAYEALTIELSPN